MTIVVATQPIRGKGAGSSKGTSTRAVRCATVSANLEFGNTCRNVAIKRRRLDVVWATGRSNTYVVGRGVIKNLLEIDVIHSILGLLSLEELK